MPWPTEKKDIFVPEVTEILKQYRKDRTLFFLFCFYRGRPDTRAENAYMQLARGDRLVVFPEQKTRTYLDLFARRLRRHGRLG